MAHELIMTYAINDDGRYRWTGRCSCEQFTCEAQSMPACLHLAEEHYADVLND